MARANSFGSPVNPPQHTLTERPLPPGGDIDRDDHMPKAEGEPDPHPATEEHPYLARHPGGANPPDETRDIGANSWAHDGTPRPRPRNATNS